MSHPWWAAMVDGRFGRLSLESSAADVLQALGEPPDVLRERGSILWQYGAFQVCFVADRVQYLLVVLEGAAVPDALGLDLDPLSDQTTPGEFERLANTHGVELRDVTPDTLRGPYVWLAGPAGTYAAFHEGRLYAFTRQRA
jgi:hypothetical protein